MKDDESRIFRIEALKRNSRGGGEAILPKFRSPRTIWLLWTLIGLAVGGGLLLWLIQVPIYTPAIAIALPNKSHEPLVAVLIPARNYSRVQVGQKVFWSFTKNGQLVTRRVIAIEPQMRSPHSVRNEFGLEGQISASITEPALVAFVNLGPLPDNLPAESHSGSVYRAEVEIGSRRVISLLPLVGRFFGNQL